MSTYVYKGAKNNSFSENSAYVLNGWPPTAISTALYTVSLLLSTLMIYLLLQLRWSAKSLGRIERY